MKPISTPFVFVLWLDAVTKHGWAEADDTADKCEVEEVWSSGHMIHRDREQVKLASDVGTDGGCNRRIAIPLGMVSRIHEGAMTGPILYQRKVRAKKTKVVGHKLVSSSQPDSGE